MRANVTPQINLSVDLAFNADFQRCNIGSAILLEINAIHMATEVLAVMQPVSFNKRLEHPVFTFILTAVTIDKGFHSQAGLDIAIAIAFTGQAKMFRLLVPSIVNPSFAALAREIDLAAKKNLYRVLIGNTYRQI